jgi:PAS domain S-box-containing protein
LENLLYTLPSLSSIVNRTPAIATPETLLSEAIYMMSQNRGNKCLLPDLDRLAETELSSTQAHIQQIAESHSAVLVLEQERLVGIFTEQDLVRLTATQTDLRGIEIGAVMTRNPHTLVLSTDETVISALSVLEQYKIRHLPIIDDRAQLVGTISSDAIRQILLASLDPSEMLRVVGNLQSQLIERALELEQTNTELRSEIARREQVENRLHRAAESLEERMTIRMAEAAFLAERVEIMKLDRVSVDTALAVSQQGISDFMQNALIGIHWVDKDGMVVWANHAELEMLGYESEEYIGRSLHDFHVDQSAAGCAFGKLLNDEPVIGFEAQMIRKDGSICDVSIDSNALFKDGKFIHARCFTRDISQQKQAEAALRQNERKFRAIFDGAFGFIGLLTVDGIVLEANQTAIIAMGAAANIIGQLFVNTIWWTHSPALQLTLQAAIDRAATGEIVRFESNHHLADGSHDITELKAGEQQIREQIAMLDVATDAIIVRNLVDFTIEFWNDGAERIYGWEAAEVIRLKTTIEIFQKDPSQVDMSPLAVLRQRGVWQGELRKFTKAGKEVIVESRCSLVRDKAGNPRAILSVETDITAKKLLEQQFFRVQRLESLGTLASGIAHDLNNILTPILGAAQLLPLTLPALNTRNQRLLNMLIDSSKRGSSLVKQILTFARGLDGKPTMLQVRHIIAEIISVARQTFPKSIEIILDLDSEDLWMVCVDATQIHQVLMNLFVNARDAMPDGGSITAIARNVMLDESYVTLHPQVSVGAYITMTIEDTGMGMDRTTIDRIFDSFFTTKELGTGLGLSTVMGIVKAHGGFINVQSTPAQGSSFQIYLPAVKARLEVPLATAPESFDGKGKLVLVVDDEAAIREITRDSLEIYNYHTMLASDGVEALTLYAQNWHRIGVVMVDMMMSQLDTPSVIQALQKINPTVKIIVMSGSILNEGIVEQYQLSAFLTKPFTPIEMMHALADFAP